MALFSMKLHTFIVSSMEFIAITTSIASCFGC